MITLFLFVQVASLLDASALWLMSGRRGGIKQKVNSESLYHPSKKPKSTRQEPHHLRSKSNQANQSSSKLESDI